MSVLIKGMEMPKDGYIDVRVFAKGHANIATGEPPFYKEMPAIEVPPHGRLIDADALYKHMVKVHNEWKEHHEQHKTVVPTVGDETMLLYAPTIIGAEEEI